MKLEEQERMAVRVKQQSMKTEETFADTGAIWQRGGAPGISFRIGRDFSGEKGILGRNGGILGGEG